MRRALAPLLLAVAGLSCKEKAKSPEPSADPAGRPAAVSLSTAALALSVQPEVLPKWTQAEPAIVTRGRRRYAVAVGAGRAAGLALSRTAAEERARAELGRLLHGKESTAGETVSVTGAQVEKTYSAGDGTVYVQLAAPVYR